MHLWPNSLNSLQVCWWCYTLNNNNIDLIPMFRKCMFFSQVCWWCPAREDQCHCRSRAQGGILPFLPLCLDCQIMQFRSVSFSEIVPPVQVVHTCQENGEVQEGGGEVQPPSYAQSQRQPATRPIEMYHLQPWGIIEHLQTSAKSTMQPASWFAIDITQDHLLEPSSLTDANPKWPVHWYCLFWLRFRWGPSPPSPLRAFFGAALVAAYKEIYLSYSTENTKPL